MRRFFYWYLPLTLAIASGAFFAYGFYTAMTGGAGKVVSAPAGPTTAMRHSFARIKPIILGDSVARGTGDETGRGIAGSLKEELTRLNRAHGETVNIAVNGSRTVDVLRQLQSPGVRRMISEANVIIISIGGNDLYGDPQVRQGSAKDPELVMTRVLGNIDQIVATIRSVNANGRIFILGLYNPFTGSPFGTMINPLIGRWTSKLIDRFEKDPNVTILQTQDLFSHRDRLSADRFHPGGEAYRIIARRIAEGL